MITIASNSGHEAYGIKTFYLDTLEDLPNLSVEEKMGSQAFVIATGQIFMINSSGEWVEI